MNKLLFAMLFSGLVVACGGSDKHAESPEGPAEEAGEGVDESANKAEDSAEKATESAGESAEKAGDNIKEETKDEE